MINRNTLPIYKNDTGAKVIKIGVKSFMCMGETPPMDHPWVFITMKNKDSVNCLYCNTTFEYDSSLSFDATQPSECYFERPPTQTSAIFDCTSLYNMKDTL